MIEPTDLSDDDLAKVVGGNARPMTFYMPQPSVDGEVAGLFRAVSVWTAASLAAGAGLRQPYTSSRSVPLAGDVPQIGAEAAGFPFLAPAPVADTVPSSSGGPATSEDSASTPSDG